MIKVKESESESVGQYCFEWARGNKKVIFISRPGIQLHLIILLTLDFVKERNRFAD